MKTKNYFFIIAFLCMSMISATAANLILNPGFEDATNTAWTLQGTTIQTTTYFDGEAWKSKIIRLKSSLK